MFLYVIKCGKCIKIGITNNVKKRLKTLQIGNAEVMEVARTVEIPDDRANEIEANMHKRFATYNVRGEWFDASAFDEILTMTDEQIINCNPQMHNKILFKYNEDGLSYASLFLSADFATEEIEDFYGGCVIFKDRSHKITTIEECRKNKWYFSVDELLDELNRDYRECLKNNNEWYEECKKNMESHEDRIKTLQNKYESALRRIDELREKYESGVQ